MKLEFRSELTKKTDFEICNPKAKLGVIFEFWKSKTDEKSFVIKSNSCFGL